MEEEETLNFETFVISLWRLVILRLFVYNNEYAEEYGI